MSEVQQPSAIEQAIKLAEQAAAASNAAAAASTPAAAPTQNAVAVAAPAGGAVAVAGTAPKLNMDSVSTGMVVDLWAKPKEFGFLLGDKAELHQEMEVVIDMTDGKGFIVKKGIKAGNPAKYWYTTDGVTCQTGGTWPAAIQAAMQIDGKAYEYRCVDVPMILNKEVVGKDGSVQAKVGARLGYTTSTTNWKNWEAFYQAVAEAGLLGQRVVAKVSVERKTNANNNAWGVFVWTLIGAEPETGE